MLISPAKRLDFKTPVQFNTTDPHFLEDIKTLGVILKAKSRTEIQSLMQLSDKLAELNYNRYQEFSEADEKPALFAFQGDTYKGLDAATLNDIAIQRAQERLGILSGLYGLLRPLDALKPYRLEMGTALQTERGASLYDFWGDKITERINTLSNTHNVILNLASNEYIKVIQRDKLNNPLIDIVFKQERNGKVKTFGMLAKRARGMMARYVFKNDIKTVQALQAFDSDGYRFIAKDSTDQEMVFFQTGP